MHSCPCNPLVPPCPHTSRSPPPPCSPPPLTPLPHQCKVAEGSYHPDNFYHYNVHAADVTQSTFSIIKADLDVKIDKDEQLSMVLSAAGHDADHPGKQ